MSAAVVQICADPRLNHDVVRQQVQQRLERLGLAADRIFILNEIGGNLSANTRNTVDMLLQAGQQIVLGGVLHHDDCVAASLGKRQPLERSRDALRELLTTRGVNATVLSGDVLTETSAVTWSDEPRPNYENFAFRMPRMGT